MEANLAQLQSCMYQYSRAIYRSIKDLIDPYVDQRDAASSTGVPCSCECEQTMSRLAARSALLRASRPGALPGHPAVLPDHRAGPGRLGGAARASAPRSTFIEQQLEAGLLDGGVARCHATTRKGKACQRTPLPGRDYCPSHQHLERTTLPARAAA